jgi:hypothetical protein
MMRNNNDIHLKHNLMKAFLHTLLFAVMALITLLTVTGCSQTELVSVAEETSAKTIRFQATMDKTVDTRAPITTMNNLEDFRVVATYNTSSKYGYFDEPETYLIDRAIVSKSDYGTWEYHPIALWPSTATKGIFAAWSPARSRNVTYTSLPPHPESSSYPAIYYTVPADINPNGQGIQQQEDLLVAYRRDVTPGSTVVLHFQHALSRVVFRARSETQGVSFYIKELTLCNVSGQGVLYINEYLDYVNEDGTLNYDDDYYGDNHIDGMWYETEDRIDYTVSLPDKGAAYVGYNRANPNDWTDLHASTNALMVIPQDTEYTETKISPVEIEDALQVKVVYNTVGTVAHADKTVYLNVCKPGTDDEPLVFEMGRQYNFNISLTESAPTFTISMSDWNVTPPDVPVPARELAFVVGDQLDQDGLRGIVSDVDDAGAARKILQIVPLPSTNLGTFSWTTDTGTYWEDLLPSDWYRLWNANADTDAQKAFPLITDPTLNASGTGFESQVMELMDESIYDYVITKDEALKTRDGNSVDWRIRYVRNAEFTYTTTGEDTAEIIIIVNPGSETTLTGVSYGFAEFPLSPSGTTDNTGILVETELDVPVYKKY